MYYGEHGVVGFVGEGGDRLQGRNVKHTHLLREGGGRAVCQRWGGRWRYQISSQRAERQRHAADIGACLLISSPIDSIESTWKKKKKKNRGQASGFRGKGRLARVFA